VVNGLQGHINVYDAAQEKALGVRWSTDKGQAVDLAPGATTEQDNRKIPLYVQMQDAQGKQFYADHIVDHTNGAHVIMYHSYEDEAGVHGENLGYGLKMSPDFNSVIHNATDVQSTVTFPFGSHSFTVTLDTQSFSSLMSIPNFPIRPAQGQVAALQFTPGGSINVAPQGIGTIAKATHKEREVSS